MRRTTLALAVLVTVLAVAPAGGAQCHPYCGQSVIEKAGELGPDDGGDGDLVPSSVTGPGIDEAGSAGPLLP